MARACLRDDPERCGLLLGFALHGEGRFPEAEEAFRGALIRMDVEERTRWTDPSVLLDGESEGWLEDAALADGGYADFVAKGTQDKAEWTILENRIQGINDQINRGQAIARYLSAELGLAK